MTTFKQGDYGRIKMGSITGRGLAGSIVKIIEDQREPTKAVRIRVLHSTNSYTPRNSRILILSDSIEPLDPNIGRMLDGD